MSAAGPRLAAVYVALFAFAGLHLPFWPVWLASKGLDAVEIGMLIATGRWVVIAASPLIAQLADRSGERRRPMIILAAGMLGGYALFFAFDTFWGFLLATVVVAFFQGSMIPLNESLTLRTVDEGRVDYGRVRLWGSLSFIVATLAGGMLLEGRPEQVILWAILAAVALILIVAVTLPDTRLAPTKLRLTAFLRLATHPTFALFLIAIALLQGSHTVVYAYGSLHWRAAGISPTLIGWLWAEGVIAEIVLFVFAAAAVRRLGVGGLLALATAAGVLRWVVLGATVEPAVLMLVQPLHGLTFGAAHLAAMAFILRAAPPGQSATAQSLYSALAMGASFAVILPLVAPLYAAVGGDAFYLMALLSVAGGLAAFGLMARWSGGVIELGRPATR